MSTYRVQTLQVVPGMVGTIIQSLHYEEGVDAIECVLFRCTRLTRAFCFVGPVTHWRL